MRPGFDPRNAARLPDMTRWRDKGVDGRVIRKDECLSGFRKPDQRPTLCLGQIDSALLLRRKPSRHISCIDYA